MDTSKIYIEMCDHPLVQCDEKGQVTVVLRREGEAQVMHRGNNVYFWVDEITTNPRCVRLLRQDQIQEKLGKTESAFCIYQAENKWGEEVYQDREQVFSIEMNSPEQLWLAFYMHEKHGLKWKDGKWQ